MKILIGRTLLRFFARITSVALFLECFLFLFLIVRNGYRFAASLANEGAPALYLLLFILLEVIALSFCWMGFLRIRKRLSIQNARIGEPLFESRERNRLTARQLGIRFVLINFFQFFAFFVAPIGYVWGLIDEQSRLAIWTQGVAILLASIFYCGFRFYPRRSRGRIAE